MSEGIPQEGAPIVPTETEAISFEHFSPTKEVTTENIETPRPVVYLPKEMPTDKEESQRVLDSIYAQAGKIVDDHAHAVKAERDHEEFLTLEQAKKENLSELAKMNAEGVAPLGFFSRLGNWIRGGK